MKQVHRIIRIVSVSPAPDWFVFQTFESNPVEGLPDRFTIEPIAVWAVVEPSGVVPLISIGGPGETGRIDVPFGSSFSTAHRSQVDGVFASYVEMGYAFCGDTDMLEGFGLSPLTIRAYTDHEPDEEDKAFADEVHARLLIEGRWKSILSLISENETGLIYAHLFPDPPQEFSWSSFSQFDTDALGGLPGTANSWREMKDTVRFLQLGNHYPVVIARSGSDELMLFSVNPQQKSETKRYRFAGSVS